MHSSFSLSLSMLQVSRIADAYTDQLRKLSVLSGQATDLRRRIRTIADAQKALGIHSHALELAEACCDNLNVTVMRTDDRDADLETCMRLLRKCSEKQESMLEAALAKLDEDLVTALARAAYDRIRASREAGLGEEGVYVMDIMMVSPPLIERIHAEVRRHALYDRNPLLAMQEDATRLGAVTVSAATAARTLAGGKSTRSN